MIKIIHFNTYAAGGSAVLMTRLHRSLRQMGHDSQVRFRHGETPDDATAVRVEYCRHPVDRFLERARYSIENRMVGAEPVSYYSRMRLHRRTPLPDSDVDCDIVHLHWVGRWLDLLSFVRTVPEHVPIVWTIHDMSPLAGGCFMDFGCQAFDSGCKRCPLLKKPLDRWWASDEIRRRQRALAGRRVVAVANSEYTRRLVERSQLFTTADKHTIHPGVDFTELRRHAKSDAKRAFGIGHDRLVLGFGAASLTDRNKGIDRFFEVASIVRQVRPETEVLIFGDGEPACPDAGLQVHRLGKLSSATELSLAMSAMDVFIVTSQMETFGQVAVEAQACGTPVLVFAVGGLPETLQPGETGGLVPYGDTGAMAAEILTCHERGRLGEMGTAGESWVRGRFGTEHTSQQYVDLYRGVRSIAK